MDTALITDTRQIMRNRLCGGIHSPSHALSALIPLCLKHCVVFTCAGFHLLMIQAVFSASGDNVLSALWEISVFWRDSLDLFAMSLPLYPPLFLSLLSFQYFFLPLSPFLLSHISPYSPRHSLLFTLSLSHLSLSFFFKSLPEESKSYLSFAHSPHF